MRSCASIVVSLCLAGALSSQTPAQTPAEKPAQAPALKPAQTPRAVADKELSAELAKIVTELGVPGIVAAAIENGEVVAIGAAGVRELGKPELVTIDDKFHLGSCTKSINATLAALCVERGEIAWNTTIGEVFKDIPMNDGWKPVTLQQLLAHRGLVPGNLSKDDLWAKLSMEEGTPTEQRMQLVAGVLAWKPEGIPGERFEYSNAGFAIAGAMLERVTKKAWEQLVQERVFEPLGITSAGFGAPGTPDVLDQPRGHRGGVAIQPGPDADNPPAIAPAGRVHMSAGDWAKYLNVFANGLKGSQSLLRPQTAKSIQEWPLVGDYSNGWSFTRRPWAHGDLPEDFSKVLTHSGSNTMWFAVTWLGPERNLGLLAMCNQGDGKVALACDRAVGSAMRYVNISLALPLNQPIPSAVNRNQGITPPTSSPDAPR